VDAGMILTVGTVDAVVKEVVSNTRSRCLRRGRGARAPAPRTSFATSCRSSRAGSPETMVERS
jgi:hypothetical protein